MDEERREMRDVKKQAFVDAYRKTGVVGPACDASGVPRSTYKHWRREDEDFDQACEDAYQDAIDAAEVELRARGVEGVEEPVLYKGEPVWKRDPNTGEILLDDNFDPIPFTITRRSDRLLEVYTKAHKPVYREKSGVELSNPDGSLATPTQVVVNFVDPPDWENVEWGEDGRPVLQDGGDAEG